MEQIKEILNKYPSLTVNEDFLIISGMLDIVDENGDFWDNYQIEIHIRDFPNRFPILFEVGGKIPKNVNWHIYSDSGSCCLTVPQKEIIACRKGVTLTEYVNKWVIPYLANQTFRFHTGSYANGEYAHNKLLATIEFYQDLFKTQDIQQILQIMRWILNNSKPDRTAFCFCGSRMKFRKCHREAYESIHLLDKSILIDDVNNLLSLPQ